MSRCSLPPSFPPLLLAVVLPGSTQHLSSSGLKDLCDHLDAQQKAPLSQLRTAQQQQQQQQQRTGATLTRSITHGSGSAQTPFSWRKLMGL